MRSPVLAYVACLLLGAALGAPAFPAETEHVPGKRWRDGPVRYLMSPEEYARYGRLSTDEARRSFVERFWRRLDLSVIALKHHSTTFVHLVNAQSPYNQIPRQLYVSCKWYLEASLIGFQVRSKPSVQSRDCSIRVIGRRPGNIAR